MEKEEDDVAPFDTAGQVTLWSRGLGFALDPAAVKTLGGSTWDPQQDSYTDEKADRGSHWTSLSSRRRRSNTLYCIVPLIDWYRISPMIYSALFDAGAIAAVLLQQMKMIQAQTFLTDGPQR